MPNADDAIYYEQRARREREIASRCSDQTIARTHLRMADAYERKLAAMRAITPMIVSQSAA